MLNYSRRMALAALMFFFMIVAGCSGEGGTSSSASLSLSVDNTTVTGGDVIVATVRLTSSTGKPVKGIEVRVMSSDPSVIANGSAYVGDNGVVTIPLTVGWTNVDKTVTLVAGSDFSSPSTSVTVTVTAPKLTINIPAEITPPTWNNNFAFIGKTIVSNYNLKFVDGNGNPIPNQVISLYIDTITNKSFDDQIVYTPLQGDLIVAPPGVFTGSTDSNGILIVPMYVQMFLNQPGPCSTDPATGAFSCTGTTISVMTVKWRAVAHFAGQSYTTTGDSLVTFTNTGV